MGLVVLILGLLLAACDPLSDITKTYEANKPQNDKAKITSFVLNGKTGTIKQSIGKITFTFKKGTDASDLTAKVLGLSAGATISPNPATTKDYTTPVLFTITAEDGTTTKTYTVKVKIPVTDADLFEWVYKQIRELRSNASLNHLDVSGVTNMKDLFNNAHTSGNRNPLKNRGLASRFNGDISKWQVDQVTNMSSMFYNATDFNQSLNDWDVDQVTNMSHMFGGADSFNGNISKWQVDKVINMSSMFSNARSFNQDLSA